jgi:tRNA A-37 threonylcarbamoyl transferase component Bud32
MSVEEVGPYTLGALLGEGAAARVYAAQDARGREVALKRLKRAASDDPLASARLEREAAVLRELDHPGLVRVLDQGRDAMDRSYLVLERVNGPSLATRIERDGAMTPNEAWRIVRQVALALRAAHAAGVLHRDLTPANVLIDERGRARLGDFGLALRTTSAEPRLSQDGAGTGTPAFMAPEQWWGAALDVRTDVYGLGGVLYACLSGRPPWHGEPAEILHRVATGEPTALTDVPPEIAAFLRRVLSREPKHRPADVDALVSEGDRAFGHVERRMPLERIAMAVLLASIPIALGFGDRHDPRAWIHEAGIGAYVVLALGAMAALLAPRLKSTRPLLLALPLVAGAAAFLTGMQRVMHHVLEAPIEERFALFHYGLAEATAGWFLGAAATSILFGLDAARDAHDVRARPNVRGALAIVACGVAAVLAAEPGAVAIAMTAIALLSRNVPARRPEAALGAAFVVASIALLAWVRLESASARLFDDATLDRAARAAALTQLDAEQSAVGMVALIALAAVLGTADWRALTAWPRARVLGALSASAAVIAVLIGPWIASRLDRAALWDELGPRLSVWRELDPPIVDGVVEPARLGVTLQLGRRRIAVDGEDVAPIQALSGEGRTGPLLVAERLGPRVTLEGDGPELVLAADRTLTFAIIARALDAAYELGVRRVLVLLAPGASPRTDPHAPWEAHVVLPRDLRALTITLTDAPDAPRPRSDSRFADVIDHWRTDPRLGVRVQ